MIEESGAWLLCWLFLVRHPSTSQQEVFLYIPAKSPPFYLKVRIGLSQIKDAIETFPALDETLYLHVDRSLNKTPVGLFISCLMDWEMKVSWLLQGCMSLVWQIVKCNHSKQLLRHVTIVLRPYVTQYFQFHFKSKPLSLEYLLQTKASEPGYLWLVV